METSATIESELRRQLEAAERRASFLAEASSILVASAIDFGGTVRALARLAVSRLGDWCVVHALERGEMHRLEAAHRDPRLDGVLARVLDQLMRPEWESALRRVLDNGQAQLFDPLPEELFADLAEEDRRALLGEAGVTPSAMIAPLHGRGRLLGALSVVSVSPWRHFDIGDISLAEELGRRAAIALDNARLYREAQEANRAKADFLAVMSHELRTPLNSIMGYTDLLQAEVSGPLSEAQHTQLDRVRNSARQLLQLIEEILGFAQTETGTGAVRVESASVAAVTQDALAVIEPLARARSLELRIELEHDGRDELRTDIGRLRQVLVNLLSNGVKFTELGGVTLRYHREDSNAIFEVSDTGIGIPPDQLDRIFDPFWQVERPNVRRVGGTGLGLAVARRHIRTLGGDITVQSEPGQGSTFTLRLPLGQPPAARSK